MKRSSVGELIKHSPKVPRFTFWIESLRNECKTYTFVKHIIDGKPDCIMIWLSNSERVFRSNSEETEIRSTSFFVLYKMAKKVHSLRSCSVNSQLEWKFQYLGVSPTHSGERLGFWREAGIWKAEFFYGWLRKAALFTSMISAVMENAIIWEPNFISLRNWTSIYL